MDRREGLVRGPGLRQAHHRLVVLGHDGGIGRHQADVAVEDARDDRSGTDRGAVVEPDPWRGRDLLRRRADRQEAGGGEQGGLEMSGHESSHGSRQARCCEAALAWP
ncbi:hypothetical protein EMGR_006070, partial [Emarellia grisea]